MYYNSCSLPGCVVLLNFVLDLKTIIYILSFIGYSTLLLGYVINEFQKKLCKVIENRKLTDSTYCLVLEKPDYKFLPGQCFNLSLKEFAVNREYSIYSSDMENHISFLIKKLMTV